MLDTHSASSACFQKAAIRVGRRCVDLSLRHGVSEMIEVMGAEIRQGVFFEVRREVFDWIEFWGVDRAVTQKVE